MKRGNKMCQKCIDLVNETNFHNVLKSFTPEKLEAVEDVLKRMGVPFNKSVFENRLNESFKKNWVDPLKDKLATEKEIADQLK